jgi:DNA polymerase-3 subunit alpha
MGFVTLDDRTARLEAVLRPAVFASAKTVLQPDTVVLMHGIVSEDSFNGGIKIDVEQVVSLAEMRAKEARALKLYVTSSVFDDSAQHTLLTLVNTYRQDDGLPLVIEYRNAQASAQLKSNWTIRPDDELIEVLMSLGWQPQVVMK